MTNYTRKQILELLRMLFEAGYLSNESDVDGIFGPNTQKALKKYREEHPETERDKMSLLDFINPKNSPLGILLRRYARPATLAGEDLINKNVIVPILKFFGFTPERRLLTEEDFSNPYLNTLDSINISQLDRRVPNWREKVKKGETVGPFVVDGNDYRDNYGGVQRHNLIERTINPEGQIETTLGSYTIRVIPSDDEDNYGYIVVNDIYDYNQGLNNNLDTNSSYGFLRNFMQNYGSNNTDPDNEKFHTEIKSKLKRR